MDYGMYGNGQLFGQMQPQQQPQQLFPRQQAYQQQPGLIGRIVQTQNDIMPGDIPMNGVPCYFPIQDGSAIYMKAWNADGTIATRAYVQAQPPKAEPTQMDRIESMLIQLINSGQKQEGNDE